MKRAQRLWPAVAIAGCLLCVLGLDNSTVKPARPPRPGLSDAEDQAKLKRMDKQLDEILEAQMAVLKLYDEIMEDLRVAKVRASQ